MTSDPEEPQRTWRGFNGGGTGRALRPHLARRTQVDPERGPSPPPRQGPQRWGWPGLWGGDGRAPAPQNCFPGP